MKSEERHDIEKNELAKLYDEASEKVGPYVSYIVYGLLAVVAIVFIVRLTSNSISSNEQQAWDSYTMATLPGRVDVDALKAAATQYAGETVGELAQLAWADSQLANGCQNFFSNKKQAVEQLDAALEEYKKIATSSADSNLRGRAQLGVAKTLEAKGDLTDAIAAYEKVTGAFSEIADERAKTLEELGAKDYASWLASAEGARRPSNFGRGARPDFSVDPLDLPGSDTSTGGVTGGEDFLEMLNRFQESAPDVEGPDRYEERDAAAADEAADMQLPDGTFPPDIIVPLNEPMTDDTADNGEEMVEEVVEEKSDESP